MASDLLFSEDDQQLNQRSVDEVWKIMIVDDEQSIHDITKLSLKKFIFEDRKLQLLHAFSGGEGKQLIKEHPDTALILLDVVMEEDHAGLDLARYIRDDLKNNFVRIILRTGQPGSAPEETIIRDYDINDYKDKTELTVQKLKTALYSSLRSYRDLVALEKNRVGLNQVIEATSSLFKEYQFEQFVSGLMLQISSVMGVSHDSLIASDDNSLLLAGCMKGEDCSEQNLKVLSGTGRFQNKKGMAVSKLLRKEDLTAINKAVANRQCVFEGGNAVFYFSNKTGVFGIIYLPGCKAISEDNNRLLQLFAKNISIAYDNVSLYEEIDETQSEVIHTLGTIAEFRSKETSQHVNRVALYSEFLAQKVGLPEKESSLIRMASPMHDIGKVGIPDSILQKPGKLTEEEFEIMKTHSQIGYEMLKGSKRPILQAAATIAHEHQEKYDGTGYPRGLKGDEIHIYGRITVVSDVFDALGSERCYKKAWPLDDIVNLFREQKGKHFDPELTQIFLDHVDDFVAIRDSLED